MPKIWWSAIALVCTLVGCQAPSSGGAGAAPSVATSSSPSATASSSGGAGGEPSACSSEPVASPPQHFGATPGVMPVAAPAAAATGTLVPVTANPGNGAQNVNAVVTVVPTCFGGTLSDAGVTTFLDGGSSIATQGVCSLSASAANTGTPYCGVSDALIDGGVGAHEGYPISAGSVVTVMAPASALVVCAADSSGDSVYGCCQ